MEILAPVAGRILPLAEVPDAVFAQEMMGAGGAIEPIECDTLEVCAPASGIVRKAKDHALVLDADGRGILLHLGIDTHSLSGLSFQFDVGVGDVLTAGEHIGTWNTAYAKAAGRSTCTVVVVIGSTSQEVSLAAEGETDAGARFLRLT